MDAKRHRAVRQNKARNRKSKPIDDDDVGLKGRLTPSPLVFSN